VFGFIAVATNTGKTGNLKKCVELKQVCLQFHLHDFSRDLPEPLFKIDIRPERKTQFLSLNHIEHDDLF
jgi:hypothetical protein